MPFVHTEGFFAGDGFFLFLETSCLKIQVDDGIFLEGYGISVSVRSSK
jgi:hypothetical protein